MFKQQQETDTVQDLYNEIEHLIDIPFDNFPYEPKDFHYKYNEEEEEEDISNTDYTFERPILIESDSDDIEEEEEELVTTPDSTISCYKCDQSIPSQPTNSLTVAGSNNICSDCNKKPRSRSNSFTFSQLADKLKQSFGHSSSNNNFLSPTAIKSVDRRKSMPSVNSVFQQDNVSPTPSRPSSRASSFIEDVKQFLAPLSRKSSRNSMFQDYQQSSPNEGPKKKTSHQSLLDTMNICKPTKRSPSYESRVINQEENSWNQEDEEVMGVVHYTNQQDNNNYVTIRRKQIKQIELSQDRIDIYNNAYNECMGIETDLVPWIIKQTQKGPPDAWFGYTPPAREPKKIMGLFKRKSKATDNNTSLRVQQQQLGDDLLNRSTPLLQHRCSNSSNLSRSPSNQSFIFSSPDQVLTASPSAIIAQHYEEEDGYFDDEIYEPKNSFPPDEPVIPTTTTQPVSILKKTNSNINMQRQYHQKSYDDNDYYDYEQEEEDITTDYHHQHFNIPPASRQQRKQQRRPSMDDWHQPPPTMMMPKEKRHGHRHQSHYMMEAPTAPTTTSYHTDYDRDDYYNNYCSQQPPYEEPAASSYYNDSIVMNKKNLCRNSQSQYYQDEQDEPYYHQASPAKKTCNKGGPTKEEHNYYGMSVKLTPYMMEEWEIALDDLCDLYPRLDRHYINDFLRSAQGDFVTAKDMIMDMIMEIR